MPFTFLLWNCIKEGKTAFHEPRTGKAVSLKPVNDECVLIYHTDCSAFRQQYGLEYSAVSDVLFFAKQAGKKPYLVVVELKSDDCARAAEQIESVVQLLQTELRKASCNAVFRAVILLTCVSPGSAVEKRLQKRLDRIKVNLKIKGGIRKGHPPVDLREFLSD